MGRLAGGVPLRVPLGVPLRVPLGVPLGVPLRVPLGVKRGRRAVGVMAAGPQGLGQ